jgi:hypothetical protein
MCIISEALTAKRKNCFVFRMFDMWLPGVSSPWVSAMSFSGVSLKCLFNISAHVFGSSERWQLSFKEMVLGRGTGSVCFLMIFQYPVYPCNPLYRISSQCFLQQITGFAVSGLVLRKCTQIFDYTLVKKVQCFNRWKLAFLTMQMAVADEVCVVSHIDLYYHACGIESL